MRGGRDSDREGDDIFDFEMPPTPPKSQEAETEEKETPRELSVSGSVLPTPEWSTKGKENTITLISLDLPRTFPGLSFFQPTGPFHHHLRKILESFVCFRPELGYVSLLSFISFLHHQKKKK
jgi:hypothetical protein